MKAKPPKEKALELLKLHGEIDEEGRSPALGIVRKFTKPEVLDREGNVIRKNPTANYWQQVEREMLATVGRKYKRPKTEAEKRKLRAEKAHKAQQKRMKKKKEKEEKKKKARLNLKDNGKSVTSDNGIVLKTPEGKMTEVTATE